MAVFEELKSIGKVLQEAGKIEQYKQILEAQKELLEMQKKIMELENKNKALKDQLEVKRNLIFENNVYWIKIKDDQKDGPFCSRCWDDENKLVRTHYLEHSDVNLCPKCKTTARFGRIL